MTNANDFMPTDGATGDLRGRSFQAERLLVVDDELPNRDMLSRRLRRAGYAVETAADGTDALLALSRGHFDLLLLDIMMPVMSGLELLKHIRNTFSSSLLPIIMVSARNESDLIVQALSTGANDYITKPIDFSVALARIQSQLARKRADDAMREIREHDALMARATKDGIWDWNLDTGQVLYSSRWKELLGYGQEEIGNTTQDWFSRIHMDDRASVEAELKRYLVTEPQGEFVSEHRMRHKTGSYRWMLCRGAIHQGTNGSGKRLVGSTSDTTTSKSFDSLTGLPNRVMLIEKLRPLLEQHRFAPKNTFAVLFIDLDGFKLVNDTLGHIAGDHLLKAVAGRLQETIRSEAPGKPDELARFGGDEFVALLVNLSNQDEALAVAGRVLGQMRLPFVLEGREVFVGASIGVAMAHPRYETPEEIIRDADAAMYCAKSSGRFTVRVFDESMRAGAIERLELQNDLAKVIEARQLILDYQPKVHMDTGRCFGFEALLRWQHPRHGLIVPDRFISIAEESGLIVPIGLWVLEQASRQLAAWHSKFPSESPLQMNVNVSVKQLDHPQFVDSVRRVLDETRIPPASLQLEMTESLIMADTEAKLAVLSDLKKLGVGLSVDDFGTGYSSLNRLDQYPFDNIKIDRSFITRIDRDERSAQVVRGILALSTSLQMDVIAEGIERRSQVDRLLHLGCRAGQGHFFSPPLSGEQAEQLLTSASLLPQDRPTLAASFHPSVNDSDRDLHDVPATAPAHCAAVMERE